MSMTLPSWQYLIIFLPVVCVIHAVLARRAGQAAPLFLIAASFAFYALVAGYTVLVLVVSVIGNGLLGRLLMRRDLGMPTRRAILAAGIVGNVALLLWIRGLEPVLGAHAGEHQASLVGMNFVSIGVSFYSLQQIAFLFDCHRGVIREFRAGTFTLASVFFPHLLAGPIVRYRELASQIEAPPEKRTPPEHLAMGLTLLTIGVAKHTMIAQPLREYLSPVLDRTSGVFAPVFPEAAIILLALALFIYFDFSAYSDMACGAACLLGYRMPVNFLSPLQSLNAAEFWRRWHITLSRFMRDYVFLPINTMLSRSLKRRGIVREEVPVVAATMATFFLLGAWHGIGETFLVWGLSVGAMVSIAQVVGIRRARGQSARQTGRIGRFVQGVATAVVTLATIALFVSPSLEQSVQLIRGLFGLNGISLPGVLEWFAAPHLPAAWVDWLRQAGVFQGWFLRSNINTGFGNKGLFLLILIAAAIGYGAPNVYRWMAPHRPVLEKVPPLTGLVAGLRWRPSIAWALALGVLAMAAIGMLANQNAGGFVYFRF